MERQEQGKEAQEGRPSCGRGTDTAKEMQLGLGSRWPPSRPLMDLWTARESMLPSLSLCFLVFSPVTHFRVRYSWIPLPRVRGTPGRNWALDRHLETTQIEGGGWCAHVFSVVRTHPHPHTQAASAGPQPPGCVARRNEVSFGESAPDSHTKPGGLS